MPARSAAWSDAVGCCGPSVITRSRSERKVLFTTFPESEAPAEQAPQLPGRRRAPLQRDAATVRAGRVENATSRDQTTHTMRASLLAKARLKSPLRAGLVCL